MVGLTVAAALAGAAMLPASAAVSTGTIYAGGLNTPGGSVWMGTHLWATDHVNGLCRLDPAPALAAPELMNRLPSTGSRAVPVGMLPATITFCPIDPAALSVSVVGLNLRRATELPLVELSGT